MARLSSNEIGLLNNLFQNILKNYSYIEDVIIPEKVEFKTILEQNRIRIVEYADFQSIRDFITKYKITTPSGLNYGLGGPTLETQFGTLCTAVYSALLNLEKDKIEYNKKKELIDKLKTFGAHVKETYIDSVTYKRKDDLKNLKIEDLEKKLKEYLKC
jgi:hypothetical protein